MRGWLPYFLIAAMAFGAYASSLGHEPVWDDRIHVFESDVVRDGLWREILARPTGSYYRPVVFSTFVLELAWLDHGAAAMRLANVALHTLAACLLLHAAILLGAPRGVATAGALLFTLHPVQTEAVTYISGRPDLLAAVFSLGALILHARARGWQGGPGRAYLLGGALLSYALALGSKESAAVLPLALFAGEWLLARSERRSTSFKHALTGTLPYLALLAVYALLRAGLPGEGLVLGNVSGLSVRLPAIFTAITDYARLLVFPFNLHLERYVTAATWDLPALFGVALIGIGLLAFWRGRAQTRFWLVWAAIAYLPAANIVPVYPGLPPNSIFAAEHFLYLPATGLLPALALALGNRLRASVGAIVLVAALVCFGGLVHARNRDWRDEETIYRHTLRFTPESARVRLNLGNLYLAQGDPRRALSEFDQGLGYRPRDTDLLTNAGLAALRLGWIPKAIEALEQVVTLEPENAGAWVNLAAAYGTAGRLGETRAAYERALVLEPGNADARRGLALLDSTPGNAP